MLKAYDYVEYTPQSFENLEAKFFDQELELAEQIVKTTRNDFPGSQHSPSCLCGSTDTMLFFTKWGVEYYRCSQCGTILAAATPDEVERYKQDSRLVSVRVSDAYQSDAKLNRETSWEELLDWIYFRSFRYTGQKNLDIIDYGNRYGALAEKIAKRSFCRGYELRDSILEEDKYSNTNIDNADVVLYINNLQHSMDPIKDLKTAGENLRDGGLMFLSTRIGTGFDILTLREHSKIFPFEHTFLPSMKTLRDIFAKAGYQVLEVSTPGSLDAAFVAKNKDKIDDRDYFVRFLMDQNNITTMQEFQRFLQKNGLSSYAQLVVQKDGGNCG